MPPSFTLKLLIVVQRQIWCFRRTLCSSYTKCPSTTEFNARCANWTRWNHWLVLCCSKTTANSNTWLWTRYKTLQSWGEAGSSSASEAVFKSLYERNAFSIACVDHKIYIYTQRSIQWRGAIGAPQDIVEFVSCVHLSYRLLFNDIDITNFSFC